MMRVHFLAACWMLCSAAYSQTVGPPESVTVEHYYADYQVNADGTFSVLEDIVVRTLNEDGVRVAGQAVVGHNESFHQADVVSAFTLKKDGTRIDVPAESIYIREPPLSQAAPVFSDTKLKVIVFPNLSAGDKIAYQIRTVQKKALFPGHFSMTQVFGMARIYEDVRIDVSVPAGALRLYTDAVDINGGQIEDQAERQRWRWTAKNLNLPPTASRRLDGSEPYVIASTFRDYAALAAAYGARARLGDVGGTKIKALAEELTAGVDEPREQARALYNWVSRNIRYVAVFLGASGVVPHEPETVLANRYGDCKDQAALLGALLAAKAIASSPVLINARGGGKLPKVPNTTTFDHVITYIPSLDVYLDSSTSYAPFGVLPPILADKPVLIVSEASLRKTPATDSMTNRSHVKTHLVFSEDGSAAGETTITEQGPLAVVSRLLLAQLTSNQEEAFVRHMMGQNASGKFVRPDPRDLTDKYVLKVKFELPKVLNFSEAGKTVVPLESMTALSATNRRAKNVRAISNQTQSNYFCQGHTVVDEYRIELPKSVNITSVPDDVHFSSGAVSYMSTYRRDNNALVVLRVFGDHMQRNFCTPSDAASEREVAVFAEKALQAEFSYAPLLSDNQPKSLPMSTSEAKPVDNPCLQQKVGDTWTFDVTIVESTGKTPVKTVETMTVAEVTNEQIRLKTEIAPTSKSSELVMLRSVCSMVRQGEIRYQKYAHSNLSGGETNWPLEVGGERVLETIAQGGGMGDTKSKEYWRALGWEKVRVAAGEFLALKVVGSRTFTGYREDNTWGYRSDELTWWYAPEIHIRVKLETHDIFGHSFQRELTSYKIH
jgi:transglutaminase-like putative cysteine protease